MAKIIKILRTIWSASLLVLAVLIVSCLMSGFLVFIALPYGAIAAVRGSEYWGNVWIGFDKLCNAMLNGDHEETISSRLGKSIFHNHRPVFGSLKFDKMVAWWLHQVDKNHCKKSIDKNVGHRIY